MLTLEESRLTLRFFKVFSILNIFPIIVDVKNGKIQRQSNKLRVFVWKILFGVGVSHWFYVFGRLVQSTVIDKEKYFKWDHFVIHFGLFVFYTVFYFIGFSLFVKNPEENVMIFNQLFEQREDPVQNRKIPLSSSRELQEEGQNQNTNKVFENPSKLELEVCPHPRPLLTWPPQYSLDELMAKLFPLAVVYSEFFFVLFLAVDPSRPQLLYSVLPPEWQNGWSFFFLLAVETLCMTIVFVTCTFANVTQVLFFGKCQLEFQRMNLQLRNLQDNLQSKKSLEGEREIWRLLRQILREMRELVVLIELFNRCFPFCIFAWKICSLSASIVYYFFVIRHFQDFPILAGFIGYCSTVITVVYSVMYGHAFSIPGKMDELKNGFLLTAQKTTSSSSSNSNCNWNRILWAEMTREVKRIRNVGIKVGGFHQMERQSTPNFIDFDLRNVVTLLVTFPR